MTFDEYWATVESFYFGATLEPYKDTIKIYAKGAWDSAKIYDDGGTLLPSCEGEEKACCDICEAGGCCKADEWDGEEWKDEEDE